MSWNGLGHINLFWNSWRRRDDKSIIHLKYDKTESHGKWGLEREETENKLCSVLAHVYCCTAASPLQGEVSQVFVESLNPRHGSMLAGLLAGWLAGRVGEAKASTGLCWWLRRCGAGGVVATGWLQLETPLGTPASAEINTLCITDNPNSPLLGPAWPSTSLHSPPPTIYRPCQPGKIDRDF